MPTPFLLIDGYNLMHAAGLARPTYGPGDLERCRHRLLRFLVNTLKNKEKSRAKVVFDAFDAPPDLSRRYSFDGLQVLFAAPGEDADSLIEELIAKHSAPRQIVVVSGDRRLQKAARRRRARSVESGPFIDRLLSRTPPDESVTLSREEDPKFDGALSAGELDQWLEFFGDVEDVAIVELSEPSPSPVEPVETTDDKEADDADSQRDEWDELFEDLGLAEELADEMRRDREFLSGDVDPDEIEREWDED